MSTRVRILSFVLFASLAVFATVSATAAGHVELRTASAQAHRRGPWDLEASLGPGAVRRQESLFASDGQFGVGSALIGSAPVQPEPAAVAVDQATHTIYVANGNNANGPISGGDTVSVIDARRCNAHDVSGCRGPWPTITVGNLPSGVAVDTSTDTVYVSNFGDGTVSVVNGATCNALTTSGCGQTPAAVPVGASPLGLFGLLAVLSG